MRGVRASSLPKGGRRFVAVVLTGANMLLPQAAFWPALPRYECLHIILMQRASRTRNGRLGVCSLRSRFHHTRTWINSSASVLAIPKFEKRPISGATKLESGHWRGLVAAGTPRTQRPGWQEAVVDCCNGDDDYINVTQYPESCK